MNRNNLLKLLELYQPSFSEAGSKKQIISFVKENINCFERSLEVGHITSSAWIINKDNSKALLLHHKKLDKWLQLGGHCDGDDNVLRVAIKEAQEESGILDIQAVSESIFDLDVHLIPKNPKEKSHYHYDIRFLLKIINDKDFIVNQEANALMWINKDVQNYPIKMSQCYVCLINGSLFEKRLYLQTSGKIAGYICITKIKIILC